MGKEIITTEVIEKAIEMLNNPIPMSTQDFLEREHKRIMEHIKIVDPETYYKIIKEEES